MKLFQKQIVIYVYSNQELSKAGFPLSFPIHPSCRVLLKIEPKEIKLNVWVSSDLYHEIRFVMWTGVQNPHNTALSVQDIILQICCKCIEQK